MPRFVILAHDHPVSHWDFLLEAGKVLRAWRLLSEPIRGQSITAEALADHRVMYLDYEGPVSGDRGRVARWDSGLFEWQVDDGDQVRVHLEGQRVRGRAVVCRSADGRWEWMWC